MANLLSLYFRRVSAEYKLIPLSVFIEGHLFVSFLADEELFSGIDFECFIEWPPERFRLLNWWWIEGIQ